MFACAVSKNDWMYTCRNLSHSFWLSSIIFEGFFAVSDWIVHLACLSVGDKSLIWYAGLLITGLIQGVDKLTSLIRLDTLGHTMLAEQCIHKAGYSFSFFCIGYFSAKWRLACSSEADHLCSLDHLRACINGPDRPPTLANKFQWTISTSKICPLDYWHGGPNTLWHRYWILPSVIPVR